MKKTYTKEELSNILNLHKKWLFGEKGGVRADLSNSDLSWSNLSNSNLRDSNLSNSDLRGSDLRYSNLRYSDFRNSNLSGSSFNGSDLSWVNLHNSNLSNADLNNADLCNSDLSNANIEGTKFSFPVTLPEGQFVAWKKVKDKNGNQFILKLIIPADAERVSTPISSKCRASKAYVDSAWDLEGNQVTETTFYSRHDRKFVYEVEKEVVEPNYNSDIRVECTSGIHFFVMEQEAREY